MTKHTARFDGNAAGYVSIMDGAEMLMSFWAWDLLAASKLKTTGETQLSFRNTAMWLSTTASVADVMAAISAAMASYLAVDRKRKAA